MPDTPAHHDPEHGRGEQRGDRVAEAEHGHASGSVGVRGCEDHDEAGHHRGAQRERAKHRVPYGARLLVDNDTAVTKGQKLAEWDPYTLPIITEKAGKAVYTDDGAGLCVTGAIAASPARALSGLPSCAACGPWPRGRPRAWPQNR